MRSQTINSIDDIEELVLKQAFHMNRYSKNLPSGRLRIRLLAPYPAHENGRHPKLYALSKMKYEDKRYKIYPAIDQQMHEALPFIVSYIQSDRCPRQFQLDLSDNGLGDDTVKTIAEMIASTNHPDKLSVLIKKNSEISDESAKYLAAAILSDNCPSHLTLDLSECSITDNGFEALVDAIFKNNSKKIYINLSKNKISPDCVLRALNSHRGTTSSTITIDDIPQNIYAEESKKLSKLVEGATAPRPDIMKYNQALMPDPLSIERIEKAVSAYQSVWFTPIRDSVEESSVELLFFNYFKNELRELCNGSSQVSIEEIDKLFDSFQETNSRLRDKANLNFHYVNYRWASLLNGFEQAYELTDMDEPNRDERIQKIKNLRDFAYENMSTIDDINPDEDDLSYEQESPINNPRR
jgi:hypothetical protein